MGPKFWTFRAWNTPSWNGPRKKPDCCIWGTHTQQRWLKFGARKGVGKLKTQNLLPLVGAGSCQEGKGWLQQWCDGEWKPPFVSVLKYVCPAPNTYLELPVAFPVPLCRVRKQKECKHTLGQREGGQCDVDFPHAGGEVGFCSWTERKLRVKQTVEGW